MQPQLASDLFALLSGATSGTLKGKIYADGDIPQGTQLPYAYYNEAGNQRTNTTHDRREGSHGVSRVAVTFAAQSVLQARQIMASALSGAQNSGYGSIRRAVLTNESDGLVEIPGQEQAIHAVTAEFSVLYKIQ